MGYRPVPMSCRAFQSIFIHHYAEMQRQKVTDEKHQLLFLGYKVNLKAPQKGKVIVANVPHGAR